MTTNIHPEHAPLASRRLHQMRDILSKAAAQRDGGDIGYAMSDAVKLIDEVLSSEPVAYITYKGYLLHASDPKLAEFSDPTPLYADPQPASEVPEVLPCPVLLEPGMRFGKGVRTQTMLDALQRRAEYYAELEEMTPEQRAEHDAGIAEFKSMLGAPGLAVPDEINNITPIEPNWGDPTYREPAIFAYGWNDCRAAMLQGKAEPVSHPYKLPDGYCAMPKKLTAENGAKGALSGEFHVTHRITCQSCGGDGCEDCNEEGGWDGEIPIGWDTIKMIYGAVVESCALPAAPQPEVNRG